MLDHAFRGEGEWRAPHLCTTGNLRTRAGRSSTPPRRRGTGLGDLPQPHRLWVRTAAALYLPQTFRLPSFPLSAGRGPEMHSLPGLRNELSELAHCWEAAPDDDGLKELLRVAHDPDDGCVADASEVLTFARLASCPAMRPSAATAPSGWSGNRMHKRLAEDRRTEPAPS